MKTKVATWLCIAASLIMACIAACCPAMLAQSFERARPGYRYEFPRDHFDHPGYQTEWWYYTGTLCAKDGHRFGFELTFFREGNTGVKTTSTWALHDVYMAHLAVSDISGHRYYSSERLNRAGPGIAGIDASSRLVWNGNWHTAIAPDAHQLSGIADTFSIDLRVAPRKAPVVHGQDGISRKSAENASHYISFTRMTATGTIQIAAKPYAVEGEAWMDHEFFTNADLQVEVGWDWLSIELENNTELMLYRLRHPDGSVDPFSSGSYIDQDGNMMHLALPDFTMVPSGPTWKSKANGATYPLGWKVDIPSLQLSLQVTTPLDDQEFVSRFGPSYWEGAIDIAGQRAGSPIRGAGYLEMTGYAGQSKPLVAR